MGVGNRSPLTRPHSHKSKLIRRGANVCSHAHYGLITANAPFPRCANRRHIDSVVAKIVLAAHDVMWFGSRPLRAPVT